MQPRETTQYGETHGRMLLRHLANAGQIVFTSAQAHAAALDIGVPDGYVNVLLSYLARGGWIVRLRKGLYAAASSLTGDLQIHPFVIATRLVEPSAISHWSALNYHGLTEQVPNAVSALTPRKVVTPSMRSARGQWRGIRHAWEVGGVEYQYFTVRAGRFFGTEEVWISELFRIPITDKERSLLETFVAPRVFGGIGEALALTEEHVGEMDLDRLVHYAVRYGKASVAKRLGWTLERLGTSDAILAPLERTAVAGMCVLDPTRPPRGPCNKRWQIQENVAK